MGTRGYRYPDVYDPTTPTAMEVKNGFWDLSDFVKEQIRKDVALRADVQTPITRVEWHFYPHRNGGVGPSDVLRQELQRNNIPYIIHTP